MNTTSRYTEVLTADDVTPEVMALAWGIIEGWYASGDEKIDWEDVWDRMDGAHLEDDSLVDLGGQTDTPAMRRIQREMRRIIREG